MGAAAIYNHLLTKHGGVGTRPKSKRAVNGAAGEKATTDGDVNSGTDVAATKPVKVAACDCGGAMGSCKVGRLESRVCMWNRSCTMRHGYDRVSSFRTRVF